MSSTSQLVFSLQKSSSGCCDIESISLAIVRQLRKPPTMLPAQVVCKACEVGRLSCSVTPFCTTQLAFPSAAFPITVVKHSNCYSNVMILCKGQLQQHVLLSVLLHHHSELRLHALRVRWYVAACGFGQVSSGCQRPPIPHIVFCVCHWHPGIATNCSFV